ncbi:polyprenol reductase-like [Lineus longissimus]|uniref:polyprenol reductase-like n=1 Tax=Lineus longissimus TaxID=88925 RepID=UPI00315CDAE7
MVALTTGAMILKPKASQLLQDIVLYGKTRGKRKALTPLQKLEVPKRWFSHFYFVGILVNFPLIVLTVQVYVSLMTPPKFICDALDVVFIGSTVRSVDAFSCVITLILVCIQVSRRCVECVWVSVYSNSTIGILQYIVGLLFYTLLGMSVLAESPELCGFKGLSLTSNHYQIQWFHALGIFIFLWASREQNRLHVMLAILRKVNAKSTDPSSFYRHRIPRGSWFEYVSCPHYTMEILIYIAMTTTQGFVNITFLWLSIFVVINQVLYAHITHQWYLAEFSQDYPKNRFALIPHVF